jgi:CheY-like chemotaxis protein
LDRRLEVLGASDRTQTLTLLARHPDCALVLLDLTLPGARGLDLLAELRRDPSSLADCRAIGDRTTPRR